MPQKIKIYDITPPSAPQKQEPSPPSLKKPTPLLKRAFLVAGGFILLAVAAFVFIKPKVTIEVWPKKENAVFSTKMIIDQGALFQADKTTSGQFASSGKKLKSVKAKGIIKIYNTYSADPQPLIVNTRFVSADGKLFRTLKRVVVPGMPGTIDVEVSADEAGPEYNIGPTTFSIPGFAGTAKYTAFYGKSSQAMTGGLKTEVPEITQQDLEAARETLIRDALAEAKLLLENQIPPSDFILLDEAISQEVVEFNPSAERGDELADFSATIKMVVRALALEKTKLRDYAKKYVVSQLPPAKRLDDASLEINYQPELIDIDNGKMVLNLKISAMVYSVFDEDSLKDVARSKKPQEIISAIKNFPEIQRARVRLWPFWAMRSPINDQRISVKLNL